MPMNEEHVSRDQFEGRRAVVDERFSRDMERLEHAEDKLNDLQRLTIVTNELVQQHEKQLAEHEERINTLERKPVSKAERIEMIILTAVISALVTAFASGIIQLK
jgi:hypothetical protein